jgi:hypothetical protein
MIAQVNSTKELKVTDILSFTWDKENNHQDITTDEDKSRLINKMKQIERELNGK